MKRPHSLLLAFAVLLLCPGVFAQAAPLSEAEILGRLAVGYSPSYIAQLVKTRGVTYSPTADFLDEVEAAGGRGILIERLSSAEADSSAPVDSSDEPVDHLAKCAEFIHEGDVNRADSECHAAIDEDPLSPWPLIATAYAMTQGWNLWPNATPDPQTREEVRKLVQKALALAPNLAPVQAVVSSPGVLMTVGTVLSPAAADERESSEAQSFDVPLNMSPPDDRSAPGNGDVITSDTDPRGGDAAVPTERNEPGPGPDATERSQLAAMNAELLRAVEAEPDLASSHVALAQGYVSTLEFDKAQNELEEALRLEPDDSGLHAQLANVYFARGDVDNGLAELREKVRIVPYGDQEHMTLAQALDTLGRTSDAIAELQGIIAVHPTHIEVSGALIDLYLKTNDRKSAIDELRRSLKASSETFSDEAKFVDARFEDLNRLGALLRENRDLDAAAEQYLYILRFKPDDGGVHNDYANVLLDQRHLDEAIAEYSEALRLEPDMSTAHHNIGLCLAMKNNIDGAIDEFRQALALNPNEPHAQALLGATLAQKGDVNGAMDQFEQLLQKDPNDADAHYGLGGIYLQKKDDFAAINEFKKALVAQPDSPAAENNLAWVYATANDPKFRNPADALSLARKAVESSPEPVPAFLDTLAEALLLNGHADEALATELKAVGLDPKNPELQSRLAHFRAAAEPVASAKP